MHRYKVQTIGVSFPFEVYKDKMNRLNLPPCSLHFRTLSQGMRVFDRFRKRYVLYTPEESVRQHFLHYLIGYLGYPDVAIATEVPVDKALRKDRADAVIYLNGGRIGAIVECKAPSVALTPNVWHQAMRYNLYFRAPLVILTNGLDHKACRIHYSEDRSEPLTQIPSFEELQQWI